MIPGMIDTLKNKLLSHLFCSVNPDDVFTVTKDGRILLGREQISRTEVESLYQEIKFIRACRIWDIVQTTLKKDAMERGFEKSTNFDDLKTAKLMLLNLDVINKIFDKVIKEGSK